MFYLATAAGLWWWLARPAQFSNKNMTQWPTIYSHICSIETIHYKHSLCLLKLYTFYVNQHLVTTLIFQQLQQPSLLWYLPPLQGHEGAAIPQLDACQGEEAPPPLKTTRGRRKNILDLVGSTSNILNTPKRVKTELSVPQETSVLSKSVASEAR